nr:RNA-directed DNA polymerase, eukaryota [Tanacetum cinerariifolium]
FSMLKQASFDFIPDGRIVWVDIEGVPFKLWSKNTFKRNAAKWGELLDVDDQEEEGFHSKRLCIYSKSGTNIYENFKVILWGKVFLIRAKEVPGWVPEFVNDSDDDDELDNGFKDGDAKERNSTNKGSKEEISGSGVWLKTGFDILMVVVYAPQELRVTYFMGLLGACANVFNAFIANAGVKEVPLGGSSFTWCHKSATKMSKLDRLLISENLMILGRGSDDIINKRLEVLNSIQHPDKIKAMDVAQKAKIKWTIEGDESTRFNKPIDNRVHIDMNFPKSITIDKQMDLECAVSKEELKRAVWQCGTDKSPGPDGFSFGFYRQFLLYIENDVFAAVSHFLTFKDIPNGCNSCFLSLIPKVPDANLVKDFRPISLIGSMYKIISEILANRLVGVLGDIVNEVQSAFITERKILDGPFILNEVIQWCKLKKKQSLIFKVDFKKAYDSVRWDFLDNVLK